MDPITFQRRELLVSHTPSLYHSLNSSFASTDLSGLTLDSTPSLAQRREAKRVRNQQRLFARERTRWEKMDEDYRRQMQKLETLSEKLKHVRKRNISEAYNPVNGDYDLQGCGRLLQQADESAYCRASRRNEFLASKKSRHFNIITGLEAHCPTLPKFHLLEKV